MFWRGVWGYLPANIVQGAVGFLTIVLFTRMLSPEEFGRYALAFSIMTLIHVALFSWLEAAMARFWGCPCFLGTATIFGAANPAAEWASPRSRTAATNVLSRAIHSGSGRCRQCVRMARLKAIRFSSAAVRLSCARGR